MSTKLPIPPLRPLTPDELKRQRADVEAINKAIEDKALNKALIGGFLLVVLTLHYAGVYMGWWI